MIQTRGIKVGDFEQEGPDPDVLRLIEKIVDQNAKILEMNAELLKSFCTPPRMVIPDFKVGDTHVHINQAASVDEFS